MKHSQLIASAILIFNISLASAHDADKKVIPIDHLLQKYSEANNTQFVLDPRVKGKVSTVGLDLENLSQSNIVDILLLHTYVAREKNGLVYVLPFSAVDHLEAENYQVWGGE